MKVKHLQPLSSLGPMPRQAEEQQEDNPARMEYLEARKLLENGKYAEAAMGFHNALCGFEEQGDRIGVANAVDKLGDACMGRGEYAMALANYERAQTICEEEDDSFSLLSLNKKMVRCLKNLGQYERALTILDDMLEHYQLTKNPQGAVDTLEMMAHVYVAQGNEKNAAEAYRAAAGIHRHFKHDNRAGELMLLAEQVEKNAL